MTESSWVDVADMKPLHRKAAIVTCPKLHVEVCVGNAVYLTNHTDEPLTLKDGEVVARCCMRRPLFGSENKGQK